MSKFLIVVDNFKVGGITTSLINFSNFLTLNGYEVEIICFESEERPQGLASSVKIKGLNRGQEIWYLNKNNMKNKKHMNLFKILILGLIKKIFNKGELWSKLCLKQNKTNPYDCAIAYRQGRTCYQYVKYAVNANCKVAFVHGELKNLNSIMKWYFLWDSFDKIACVSQAVKQQLIERFGRYQKKYVVMPNLFDVNELYKLANKKNIAPYNSFTFISVNRMEYDKGADRIIEIYDYIKKNCNVSFNWLIIGSGTLYNEIKSQIKEKDLVLLGEKRNPFPYIKNSDCFVSMSRSEAFGMAIKEAQLLGVPAIVGAYPAAREIIVDGITGKIVANDSKSIAEEMIEFLENSQVIERYKNNLLKEEYNPKVIIDKFVEECIGEKNYE